MDLIPTVLVRETVEITKLHFFTFKKLKKSRQVKSRRKKNIQKIRFYFCTNFFCDAMHYLSGVTGLTTASNSTGVKEMLLTRQVT